MSSFTTLELYFVKFIFSEKATKILQNLPVDLMFTNKFQINWNVSSNFCCLHFTISNIKTEAKLFLEAKSSFLLPKVKYWSKMAISMHLRHRTSLLSTPGQFLPELLP